METSKDIKDHYSRGGYRLHLLTKSEYPLLPSC